MGLAVAREADRQGSQRGAAPEKPYSGTLSLRISPELHRRIAEQAAKAGESINRFIVDRLEEVA